MIDLSDVCRNSCFDQWFSVFFIIHLASLRSLKIAQESVKSQEKSGNFLASDEWQPCKKCIAICKESSCLELLIQGSYIYIRMAPSGYLRRNLYNMVAPL